MVKLLNMYKYILAFAFLPMPNSLAMDIGSAKPSIAVEPISGIIDAFKTHSLVALGEGMHGNEQGHSFRLSLVSNTEPYQKLWYNRFMLAVPSWQQ